MSMIIMVRLTKPKLLREAVFKNLPENVILDWEKTSETLQQEHSLSIIYPDYISVNFPFFDGVGSSFEENLQKSLDSYVEQRYRKEAHAQLWNSVCSKLNTATTGDDFDHNVNELATAGITMGKHTNAIEVYAPTLHEAQMLRDEVLGFICEGIKKKEVNNG